MSEREDQFRRHAAECLLLTHGTKDPVRRQALIHMALRWTGLAEAAHQDLNTLLADYNEQKMVHPRAVDQQPAQQQQQIQPNSDDKDKE